MIHGVGVDVLRLEKLTYVCKMPDDPFIVRSFTEAERGEAERRHSPLVYYSSRFAGKEAVFKALRISPDRVSLGEIEILNDEDGKPYVNLYGKLKGVADKNDLQLHISISYEAEEVIAYAIAEVK